ncbi:MAG: hypothetical protein HON97_03010 [Polaribacter sp.]|nr:hypothetical protein [Polaribacter sp.]
MINKISFIKLIVLASLIPSLYLSFNPGKIVIPTLLTLYPSLFLLIILILTERFVLMDEKKTVLIFVLYWLFTFSRGIYDAKTFQDWTVLLSHSASGFVFLPLTIYLGALKKFVGPFIQNLFIAIPVIFILTHAGVDSSPYGFVKTLSSSFLIFLMFPLLDKKLKLFVILLLFFIVSYDITIRSSILYAIVIILCILTYYFRSNEMLILFKIMRKAFLFIPLLLALLGAAGTFNVFQIGGNYKAIEITDEENNQKQDLLVDSRTGIYNDVHTSLFEQNRVLFGLGGVGKTDTFLTKNENNQIYRKLYEEGRRGTEARILSYYQWGGVLGGLLYLLLILKASYLAMYRSRNWFMTTLGLFVSFSFVMSFIADPPVYNLSSFTSFLMVGMCFNRELRSMNEKEIKAYLRSHLKGFTLTKNNRI